MAGIQSKLAAIVHKYKGVPFKVQNGSYRQTTLTQGVLITSAVLDSWIIFKEKVPYLYQFKMLCDFKHTHICMSKNRWTNNNIGYKQFTYLFDPQIHFRQKGNTHLFVIADRNARHSDCLNKYKEV